MQTQSKAGERMLERKKGHNTKVPKEAKGGVDVGKVKRGACARCMCPSGPATCKARRKGLKHLRRIHSLCPTKGWIVLEISIKLDKLEEVTIYVTGPRKTACRGQGKVNPKGAAAKK